MFYKKKKNAPLEWDFILYPSSKVLMKYEWISIDRFARERKNGMIRTVYSLVENKWQFIRYRKWYIRFTSVLDIDKTHKTLSRLAKIGK